MPEGLGRWIAYPPEFEIRLGNYFAKSAAPTAQTMIGKVKAYVDAKMAKFGTSEQAVEEELAKLGGPLYAQWAGRGGLKADGIQAILNGGGNIREAITMFSNFVENIFAKDMMSNDGLQVDALEDIAVKLGVSRLDIVKRRATSKQKFNEAKEKAKANAASPTPNPDIRAPDQGTLDWGFVVADPKVGNATAEQSATRDNKTMPQAQNPLAGNAVATAAGADGQHFDDPRNFGSNRRKDVESDNWWLHQMTVEEFERLGGELTETEKGLFNEGVYRQTLASLKDTIQTPEDLEAAIALAEEEAKKYVPWAAGMMGYTIKSPTSGVASEFMTKINELGVPMAAGVSGTTARTMSSAITFGIPAEEARDVCLGYLLPIQAHSFAEIMQSASQWGFGYAPQRGSANYLQSGIEGDARATPGWAEFHAEYAPDKIGPRVA